MRDSASKWHIHKNIKIFCNYVKDFRTLFDLSMQVNFYELPKYIS